GLPFTPTISADTANTGVGSQRPQVTGAPTMVRDPLCWFYISVNTSCAALAPGTQNAFAVPTAFTYGNGGRNLLRGDNLIQFDLSARKRFQFSEFRAVEFRAEFFNLFNHPSFARPTGTGTNVNVAAGGQIASTLNAARTIELALKIFF